MVVDTKKVTGRRQLTFATLTDVVEDAEKLVSSPHARMLGNWPLGQLLTHLARAINGSIDGISAKAPWFIRLMGPFIKRRLLTKGMSAGFQLPGARQAELFPPTASAQEGFETLRRAVGRLTTEKMTARHPVLGQLTHEEWTQLHLRHAELHLSFAVPG